jgi:hypothetical protein
MRLFAYVFLSLSLLSSFVASEDAAAGKVKHDYQVSVSREKSKARC